MYLTLASMLNSFAYDAANSEREKALFAGIGSLIGVYSTARSITATIHAMELTEGHLRNVIKQNGSTNKQKAA